MRPTLNTQAQTAGWEFAHQNPGEATLSNIANAGGVSTGTAAKWMRQWRDELGEDLFRDELQQARAEHLEAARNQARIAWVEMREQEAVNLADAAGQIRAQMLDVLPLVGSPQFHSREIKYLADALVKLLDSAEGLALPLGAHPSGGSLHRPDVDLSGLEETPEHHQAQQAAIAVISQFKARKAAG